VTVTEHEPDGSDDLNVEAAAVDVDAETADEAEGDAPSTHAVFAGDEGSLDLEVRRALVVLMKHRFITSRSHPKEWRTVAAHRQTIAGRLNDLLLELKVDPEREVAYKRPVTSDTGAREFPTLLHDTVWPREETALLVYLRVRARAEQSRGEPVTRVSQAELLAYLRENRPPSATDQVKEERRAERAVAVLKTAGLLEKTAEDGVFRISPAVETMLPMTVLTDLLSWLTVRNESGPMSDEEAAREAQS